jgi:hypothetical protein
MIEERDKEKTGKLDHAAARLVGIAACGQFRVRLPILSAALSLQIREKSGNRIGILRVSINAVEIFRIKKRNVCEDIAKVTG